MSAPADSFWQRLFAVIGPVALAAATWAHGLLWGHEGRLTTLEVKREAADQASVEHRAALERKLDKIDAAITALGDKIR